MSKYVFVTGGVCSSLGKGVVAASLGSLLESRNFSVQMIKVDPYINVDAGTMNPYQHGEVYVTDDGTETDLDIGNYARFTHSPLSHANSITTGQVYQEVIHDERQGNYLGRTVQVIPHITNKIKQRIRAVGDNGVSDVTIVEIGGTVGDIESYPFLEAVRQLIHELGKGNAVAVHLTLVPEVSNGERKTKPTQHSVKELREIGIQPDILMCRTPSPLSDELRNKIALFTNVDEGAVISAYDFHHTIYEVPIIYHKQKLDAVVMSRLGLKSHKADISSWKNVVYVLTKAKHCVTILIVGKYTQLNDAYKSIDEALIHGGVANECRVELVKIEAEELEAESNVEKVFSNVSGILVPGGFGDRGVAGMIKTVQYAREHAIPFFGICMGMQIMVIEYARNVLGYADANNTEFAEDCTHPVISLLADQVDVKTYGGTMRLGRSASRLFRSTKICDIYKTEIIYERHRHRYEVSNKYRQLLNDAGLTISGVTQDYSLVEAVEWEAHPWGIGVQFHPEFQSRPVQAHPLFSSFIAAAKR